MSEEVHTIVQSSLQSIVPYTNEQHLQSLYNKAVAKNKQLIKQGHSSFQIASAIYDNIINQASLPSINSQYIAVCEYLLSRLFSSLESNPFIGHFLSLKDKQGPIGAVVRAILLGKDVRNQTLSSLQVDDTVWDTAIDTNLYTEILKSQWLRPDEIERILDPIKCVYDLNMKLSLDDPNYQLLIDRAVLRVTIESIDLVKLFPHRPITFVIIDKFFQVEPRGTLKQLTRMQANNASTDFLFILIVDHHIGPDDTRVLIYEFVLYNLQQSTVYENTVRLLSRFVLSLARANVLQPLDNFSILFSSFINWIGTVDEARQVYMLGKGPDD
jgi:hypothetical protein